MMAPTRSQAVAELVAQVQPDLVAPVEERVALAQRAAQRLAMAQVQVEIAATQPEVA